MAPLYKTTVIIWSEYDPSSLGTDPETLAFEAMRGDAYMSSMSTILVQDPFKDPHPPGPEFFWSGDDEEE